jgi:aspartyl-tRNA(Asn)/glutamyl-tRNA(Gln) amidotransferase subunit C
MNISKDTIKYVADLARIELSESDLENFTGQLDRILEYVHKIEALDMEKLEPTSHVLDLKNVYREDTAKDSLSAAEAIKNAPDKEDGLFKVKKIIEA